MKPIQDKKTVRGAILLEAILALLFVVLTVGAVSGLFTQSLKNVRRSEMQTRAMFLAENKLAEMQLGIRDVTESSQGDFNGRPPNFSWMIRIEDTQVPELRRVTITITYDDPYDGFDYTVHRLYSPSLNMSAEMMRDIATDPVQMQALGAASAGLENLLSLLGEFPGGDKIMEALLRGGVPAMMDLFNKIAGGDWSTLDFLEDLQGDRFDDDSLGMMMTDGSRPSAPPWTNYDTAGIGDKPPLRVDAGLAADDPGETEAPDGQRDPSEERTDRRRRADRDRSEMEGMTREEAIQRMTEMLRRMAEERQ